MTVPPAYLPLWTRQPAGYSNPQREAPAALVAANNAVESVLEIGGCAETAWRSRPGH
jgi:hypothetical protein